MSDPDDTLLHEMSLPKRRRPVIFGAARQSFAVAAGVSVLLALIALALPEAAPEADRPWSAALFLAYGGLALIALRARASQLQAAGLALALAAVATLATGAVLSGRGSESPMLGLLGLVALTTCALAPRRVGVLVTTVSALTVAALAGAEWEGLLPAARGAAAGDALQSTLQTALQLGLLIAGGAAAGGLLARLRGRQAQAGGERDSRFQRLLSIAGEAYWEIDASYRLTQLTRTPRGGSSPEPADFELLGQEPWELPSLAIDPDVLDQLQADLDTRASFRDLPVRWITSDDDLRHLAVSGEPRLDARGVFRGYWGVARDVTAEWRARDALIATESRFQDLFDHLPTALLLHRKGRILDANPSALALFGHDDLAELGGRDILTLMDDAESRERARRRFDEIESMPVGKALPVADFRLRGGAGRSVTARGTAVRVEAGEGPATLTILVDDTERRAAEDAVRRSEAMLSHLVATSPELIMLADQASGRLAMVNRTFEQALGWNAADVTGRSAAEVGVWTEASGQALTAALQRDGKAQEVPMEFNTRDGRTLSMRVSAARFAMERRDYLVINARDVTRQREAEAALASARDGAEAANRAKSAFLANTSHELRTPLNGIIGLARLARDPTLDTERRRDYLDQISDSAQSLAAIINDILDLSKIEAGKLTLEVTPFDLTGLLQALQVGYAVLAEAHGLKLRLEVEPGAHGTVRGDALRVRQILSNYLSNALKFTAMGEVRLAVRRLDARQLRFEVHDTGPGIDPAAQARLFRPFSQADETVARRFGGTGLGLSICRELAELMGGRVGVESTVGQGSCFWAVLPLTAVEPAGAVTPDTPPDVSGARVLLVEDNSVNMLIASAMLGKWGVVVEQAFDGPQAVAAVARAQAEGRPFDAVLMDVQMPQMSGYEATRILRARYGADALPIIALTAGAFASEREEALAAGMNDFLTKPIDADRLRAALARWVSWRSALRA